MNTKYTFNYLDACNKANFTKERVREKYEAVTRHNVSRSEAISKLQSSLKYFENRVNDYQRALQGASYFLEQLKCPEYEFDEISRLYWSLAFDPCSRHSSDSFASLDRVFEAVRDKLVNIELGD